MTAAVILSLAMITMTTNQTKKPEYIRKNGSNPIRPEEPDWAEALLKFNDDIEMLCKLVEDLDSRVRRQKGINQKIIKRLEAIECRKCDCQQVLPVVISVARPLEASPIPTCEPEILLSDDHETLTTPKIVRRDEPKPRIIIRNHIVPCETDDGERTIRINGETHVIPSGGEIILRPNAGTVRAEYVGSEYKWETTEWGKKTKVLHLK